MTASPQDVLASDEATEQARVHYREAQEQFDLGMWDAAIAEFSKAYELRQDPTQAPKDYKFFRWMSPDHGPESGVWHRDSEHSHPDFGTCRIAHVLVDLRQKSRRGASTV